MSTRKPDASRIRPNASLIRDDWLLPGGITTPMAEHFGIKVRREPARIVPEVLNLWVRQDLGDGWAAAFRLVRGGGRLRVGEVRIFPDETETAFLLSDWSGSWRGLDASAPPRLPAGVVRRIQPHRWPQVIEAVGWRHFAEELGMSARKPAPPAGGRPGRKPLSDVFLAEIARDYADAIRRGSRHPLRDVAERQKANIAVARGWVYRARERGFLVGRAWGRATGALSPAASILLLREHRRPTKRRRLTRQSARRK